MLTLGLMTLQASDFALGRDDSAWSMDEGRRDCASLFLTG